MLSADASLLNVSLPAIGRDLGGDLLLLKWVVTGKSLVFASLMLSSGRLGDVLGHRRLFMSGGLMFSAGALVAVTAGSLPVLLVGESVIKGVGATIMLPSTMAILAHAYEGRQRLTAFAAWGGVAGAGAAFGPVIGGLLTQQLSWRWCIGLTGLLAPLAVVAGSKVVPARRADPKQSAGRFDLLGSTLIAVGVGLLVAGLSEGARLGWWKSLAEVTWGGSTIWGPERRVALTPILLATAAICLVLFVAHSIRMARLGRTAMLDVRNFRLPAFRYGLAAGVMAAAGQWGVVFTLPIFLQVGLGLSPLAAGLWLLPAGLSTLLFAQFGAKLAVTRQPAAVVRLGLGVQALGTIYLAVVAGPGAATALLTPGLALYGIGFGLVTSQLANSVIAAVPPADAGVASAATITARQIGAAFGVAVLGSLLTVGATSRLLSEAEDTPRLTAGERTELVERTRREGLDLRSVAELDHPVVTELVGESMARSARVPLLAASAIVAFAAALPAPAPVWRRRNRPEAPDPPLT